VLSRKVTQAVLSAPGRSPAPNVVFHMHNESGIPLAGGQTSARWDAGMESWVFSMWVKAVQNNTANSGFVANVARPRY
jgi:hypothetical protein